MEDELWLKKIKDKLEDYSEPLPVAGWERLEKELSVSGAPITGPHRMIPFRRWAVAAAAVLLVAVSSVRTGRQPPSPANKQPIPGQKAGLTTSPGIPDKKRDDPHRGRPFF